MLLWMCWQIFEKAPKLGSLLLHRVMQWTEHQNTQTVDAPLREDGSVFESHCLSECMLVVDVDWRALPPSSCCHHVHALCVQCALDENGA